MKPRISVVVATYRRPTMIRLAVRSILASEHDSFDLTVAEQDEETSLLDFRQDPRLRILRLPPEGVSAARNRATQEASADLIAYTDDDCEVSPRWLLSCEQAFQNHTAAGVVLGSVLAGDHDASKGFVPACPRRMVRLHRRPVDCAGLEVMGASMAVRRDVWQSLGGFWGELGGGRSIRAGEDYDLAVRALLAGIGVLEYPEAAVTHHGFRTWEEGWTLLDGYTYGTAYVVGYRLGKRPVDMIRCLRRFWKSYRSRKSLIIGSAGRSADRRLLAFCRGWATGVGACWRSRQERHGDAGVDS